MSWYNDDLNNGFIDTTQDFVGGGGSSTSITNIQEDLTALKEVFKPKVLDNTNASLDTIIVNNTANSRIFLQNANTSPNAVRRRSATLISPAATRSLIDCSLYARTASLPGYGVCLPAKTK